MNYSKLPLSVIVIFIWITGSSQQFEITNLKKKKTIRSSDLIELAYGKLNAEGYIEGAVFTSVGKLKGVDKDSITLEIHETNINYINPENEPTLAYDGRMGIKKIAHNDLVLMNILESQKRFKTRNTINKIGNFLFVGGGISFFNSILFAQGDKLTPMISSTVLTLVGSILRVFTQKKMYRFNSFYDPWRFT